MRGIPSRFVHRVIGSVPLNPPKPPKTPWIRRRHQNEPDRSHRWCKPGTPPTSKMRRLGRENWLPLGSNGVRSLEISALPCCLARFGVMWSARAAQHTENPPCSLQKSLLHPPAPSSYKGMQASPGCCLLACSIRGLFVGFFLNCGHGVLFLMQHGDDSHVQHASLHWGHECAHHFMSKAVIIPCLSQKIIAKSYASLSFLQCCLSRVEISST